MRIAEYLQTGKKVVEQHKVQGLEGFGEKITPIAQELERKLRSLKEVEKLDAVGSDRRRKETIGDLDILVVSDNAPKVMDFFTKIDRPITVLAKGPTKSSVLLSSGLRVDIRVLDESSYGSALLYYVTSRRPLDLSKG